MLPCVLHPDRIRGTYPRLKTYSDLKYLPDFLRLENTSAIKSLQKKSIYIQKQGLAPRFVRRYTARNGSGSILTHIVADGYERYLYRVASPNIGTNTYTTLRTTPDRIRGTYPRYKTYSDLWQLRGKDFAMISLKVPTGTYKSM